MLAISYWYAIVINIIVYTTDGSSTYIRMTLLCSEDSPNTSINIRYTIPIIGKDKQNIFKSSINTDSITLGKYEKTLPIETLPLI